MLNLLPPYMEDELLKYIKKTYLPDRFRRSAPASSFTSKDLHLFSKGAADLSEAFTSGRKELPKNYFNKKENRSAYLLYFTLTNFSKTIKCLDEAFENEPPVKKEFHILDIGCGPATSAIACSKYLASKFPGIDISILGIDQNKEILNDARRLFRLLGHPGHRFDVRAETIRPETIVHALKERCFDLIIAANVLNELGGIEAQYKLCRSLIERYLNEGGVFIVIDPALQKTTRQIMELRNLILQSIPGITIKCPCTHAFPCPMLSFNRRDWCHFYLEWKCPDIIRNVDKLLGIKHNYLKMAYLVFKKYSKRAVQTSKAHWRVVSSPLKSKGKIEIVLCGEGRLKRIVRLDKDSSEKNRIFDKIKRGDLIVSETLKDRIEKGSVININRPFNFLSPIFRA